MDNQQGKVSELELAWLAGFLDGEGCFDMQRSYSKGLREERFRPRIRVSNTHVKTLNDVDQIMSKMLAGHHISWRYPENSKYKPSWSIEVCGYKRAFKFLLQITPYLKTKQRQAEMLIDFINSRMKVSTKDLYSNSELCILGEFGKTVR